MTTRTPAHWWLPPGPPPSSWNMLLIVVVVVTMLLHIATRLAAAQPYKYPRAAGDAGRVTVSEVSSEELRGKRAHAATATAPAVRSVDIQPAAREMMALRTPTPTPTPTSTTPTSTTPTPTNTTVPTNSTNPTNPTNPTTVSAKLLENHGELPRSTSRAGATRLRWTAGGYALLVTATLLTLCGPSAVHAVEVTTGYIVLVGLPVLDRVLPLKNLAQELLQRGYHVGFALPEHCRHWVADLDRLEFISLGNLLPIASPMPSAVEPSNVDLDDAAAVYESYAATLRGFATLQRPMFSALVDEFEEDRPELVIVDRYAFAGFDACHKLAIPFVVHAPSLLIDLDAPPAYVPAPFSAFTMHTPSVLARCKNSLDRLRFRLATVRVFREVNRVRTEHGLDAIHGKDDLFGHQLVLVSSMFGLDAPRPITPQFQMIGMLEPTQPPTKKLSVELERWIARDSVKPLVFISFQGDDAPLAPEFVALLLQGLEHIGVRLVWKISLEEQAAFDLGARPRESVFFVRDDDALMDESLVLQRAPVSLLITAGNHYSVLQAFALGVPVLGIPSTAEQWETMNMVARTGAGIKLKKTSLSCASVRDAAMALLYKPQFAAAAFRLGEIVKTGGGTKRAADHVQSVLEFGPAHVLPARNSLPLYRTYLVDVYAVYGLILFCSAIVLRSCFGALYHILQLAPDVHLGVTLDDDGDDVANHGDGGGGQHHQHHQHHDVHKPGTQGHGHNHHHHDHTHHHNHQHVAHGKDKHCL